MKVVDIAKAVGGVVAIVVACQAYAQSSDAAAMAPAASAPMSQKADKKAARKMNHKLGVDVRRALDKAGIDVSGIAVRASGGAVTLDGTVPEAGQIDKAGEAAKEVAGVNSVNNKLRVKQQ
jgi:hyperosmotically inducible periplasmic protein